MKIPKGKLRKITGFVLETEAGSYVAFENDYAYIERHGGGFHRILRDGKARELYNDLYKRFPK